MKKTFILLAISVLLASCPNNENYKRISGQWECTSWVNQSKNIDKCRNNVRFEFRQDKTYNSGLGGARDSGDYRIMNDLLYVTPKGKLEFAVQITKLTGDTLVFLMNQAGEEEILTLKRIKQ